MFVSGLYCSQRFQNIIPYYTRVYRKLTAVYKTGTGVKGTLGHVWGLWDLGTSSMGHLGQGCGASNTVDAGIWMIIAKIRGKSLPDLPRLIETKHFPESKTLPRNESTSQSPKYIPGSKTLPRIQNKSQNPKLFWILGSVLSLWATVDISHFPREYVLVKQPTLPSLWFQNLHCPQCRGSSPR